MPPLTQHSAANAHFASPIQFLPRSFFGHGRARVGTQETHPGEGSLFLRVMLVLSSVSPLFLLWAIRGTSLIPEPLFWGICLLLLAAPNFYLWWIVRRAKREKITRPIEIGESDDRRQDLISYLFAMLLPFYTVDLSTWRNLAATVAAFVIVVVLFTSLNMHYMNFFLALRGYHCFQVRTPESEYTTSSAPSFMLISRRSRLQPGTTLVGYRLSPTVLLEGT